MSAYVRSRKFFCCLPVRLGVFIISLLTMVGGSFVAAMGWVQVAQLPNHPLEQADQIALYIHSSLFSILGLMSIFGFLGCLLRSRGMVQGFGIGLAIHFGFSVASGVFTLITLFKQNSKESIDKCMNGNDDDATLELCKGGLAVVKGIMVAIYIVAWLLQIYAYFVVDRYVEQLDDEEMAERTVVIPRSMVQDTQIGGPQIISGPQVTTYNGFGSSGPTSYPFSASNNAHGVARGHDPSNRV